MTNEANKRKSTRIYCEYSTL